MKTTSGGFYCVHLIAIADCCYFYWPAAKVAIQYLNKKTDIKNIRANRSQLHTRLQYNFYWLFNITIKINLNK